MGMPSLEALNLENAELRVLQIEDDAKTAPDAKSAYGRLKELRLRGNPLVCDCRARGLWRLARSSSKKEITVELPDCQTPFSVRNKKLEDMEGEPAANVVRCCLERLERQTNRSRFLKALFTFPSYAFFRDAEKEIEG